MLVFSLFSSIIKKIRIFWSFLMHFSFDSDSFSLLCLGSFLLVFFVMTIIAIAYAAKRKKAIQEVAQKSGFSPAKDLPGRYQESLQAAYAPEDLRRVKPQWQKTYPEGTLVIFDSSIHKTSSDGDSNEAQRGNLALFSPLLDLPHFFIIPRLQAPLQLGNYLDQMMASGASRLGMSLNQSIPPEFDRVYLLYCAPEAASTALVPETALLYLAQHPGFIVRVHADTLVLSDPYASQRQALSTRLEENITVLREICVRFSARA